MNRSQRKWPPHASAAIDAVEAISKLAGQYADGVDLAIKADGRYGICLDGTFTAEELEALARVARQFEVDESTAKTKARG